MFSELFILEGIIICLGSRDAFFFFLMVIRLESAYLDGSLYSTQLFLDKQPNLFCGRKAKEREAPVQEFSVDRK